MSSKNDSLLHQWAVDNVVSARPLRNGTWCVWMQVAHNVVTAFGRDPHAAIRQLMSKREGRKEP